MSMNYERNWMSDTLSGAHRLLAVGARVKAWMHLGARGAVLRRDILTYIEMPFIHFTKDEAYGSRMALIVQNSLDLADTSAVIHSLEYVASSRPYVTLHAWTNVEYWWKEIQYERQVSSSAKSCTNLK